MSLTVSDAYAELSPAASKMTGDNSQSAAHKRPMHDEGDLKQQQQQQRETTTTNTTTTRTTAATTTGTEADTQTGDAKRPKTDANSSGM